MRDAARRELRGFIDQIVIPPADGLLQVTGNLGMMLDATAGQKVPGRQDVMLVAGARNHLNLEFAWAAA